MKKTVKSTLNTELTIDGDRITIEQKHWTSFVQNRENPSFLIGDIKSIDWKPKSTWTERPNIYFNVRGFDTKRDMMGNRSNDPYCFYFTSKELEEMTEIYNYIMDRKSKLNNPNLIVDDIPSQIKKLSDLKDQGIITEEEFQIKKIELLKKM
jgi:hypothetical protein